MATTRNAGVRGQRARGTGAARNSRPRARGPACIPAGPSAAGVRGADSVFEIRDADEPHPRRRCPLRPNGLARPAVNATALYAPSGSPHRDRSAMSSSEYGSEADVDLVPLPLMTSRGRGPRRQLELDFASDRRGGRRAVSQDRAR